MTKEYHLSGNHPDPGSSFRRGALLTSGMAVEMTKPWQPLNAETVGRLPGQLGVFELASEAEELLYIGFAGGRSLFGLRGELMDRLEDAALFRIEVTASYRTRHRELLMASFAQRGSYPPLNTESETRHLGRLSPS